MSEVKKVPKIRFAGFAEPWEQRKLSAIADKVTEKNTDLAIQETFTNSAEFGIISQRDFFDHDISNAENINGYYVVRSEDFVYNPRISTSAPVGPVNRNKLGRNGVMSPLYTVFRTHDIDTTYLEWFFKSSYWHPFMFFNGDSGARSDRFSIKDAIFFEMPIPVPSLAEQREIGAYMNKLDNLIILHQRKLDRLVILKQAMLEKMFPQKGNTTPEVRFTGFTGSWEQRKLGDLTNILSASRVHKDEWRTSGVPFFRSSDVMAAFNGTQNEKAFIDPSLFEKLSAISGKPEKGDLFITGGGSVGIPYIVPNDEPLYSKDADLIWIKHNPNTDPDFLYTYFVSPFFRKYLMSISHVGTIAHYTIEQVKATPIYLPEIDEQMKIGTLFRNLDTLITLQQRKCESLKHVKAALLQKMFV